VQIQQDRSTPRRSLPEQVRAGGFGRGLLGDQGTWVRRYLAVLIILEVVVRVWGSLPGSLLYAVVVLLLVNHQLIIDAAWSPSTASATGGRDLMPVFLILTIAAVARLGSLAMGGVLDVWFGGYGFAALAMSLALWRLRRVRGLSSSLPWGAPNGRQLAIALVGVPLALGGFFASRPPPELDWWDLTWQLWLSVALFGLAGAVDEWFYQGYVRGALGSGLDTSGVGASALLYAICHGDMGLAALGTLVLANVVFGILARRTGSLVGACIGHAALNMLLVFMLPYSWPH
jgi:hypothetical protein